MEIQITIRPWQNYVLSECFIYIEIVQLGLFACISKWVSITFLHSALYFHMKKSTTEIVCCGIVNTLPCSSLVVQMDNAHDSRLSTVLGLVAVLWALLQLLTNKNDHLLTMLSEKTNEKKTQTFYLQWLKKYVKNVLCSDGCLENTTHAYPRLRSQAKLPLIWLIFEKNFKLTLHHFLIQTHQTSTVPNIKRKYNYCKFTSHQKKMISYN